MIKRDSWVQKLVCCVTTVCFLSVSTGSVFAQDSTKVSKSPQTTATATPPTTAAPQTTATPPTTAAPQTTATPPTTVVPQATATPQPIAAPEAQTKPPVAAKIGQGSVGFDEYLRGKTDGAYEAKGSPAWIFAGLAGTYLCLCIGVAGIGLSLLAPPNPPETALMGKSSYYIAGYTEAYKSKGKWKNATWASVGCAMAALINIIINLASGNNVFKTTQ